jgi:hypothetical protein
MQPTEYAPVYTGNNVYIVINSKIIGFVETLSITRSVNRRPVYGVGGPLFIDAPVTQVTVTVTATHMVPLQGQSNSAPSLAAQGMVPSGSLADQVYAGSYDMAILEQINGKPVWYVRQAKYNQDAVQVPGTDIVTYNLSWVARDTMAWT